MSKYIDAERLIAYLEREAEIEFKKTEENANSPVICHFHNGCRMQALDTIDFIKTLQQEQPDVDLEKEVDDYFCSIERWQVEEEPYRQLDKCARHFYELGQQEMRHRIMNPEYNAKVVKQLKSEHPTIKEE